MIDILNELHDRMSLAGGPCAGRQLKMGKVALAEMTRQCVQTLRTMGGYTNEDAKRKGASVTVYMGMPFILDESLPEQCIELSCIGSSLPKLYAWVGGIFNEIDCLALADRWLAARRKDLAANQSNVKEPVHA